MSLEKHNSYIILLISKFLPKYTMAGDAKDFLTYQICLFAKQRCYLEQTFIAYSNKVRIHINQICC